MGLAVTTTEPCVIHALAQDNGHALFVAVLLTAVQQGVAVGGEQREAGESSNSPAF